VEKEGQVHGKSKIKDQSKNRDQKDQVQDQNQDPNQDQDREVENLELINLFISFKAYQLKEIIIIFFYEFF